MSSAHITAGLPVQDTSTAASSGNAAHITAGLPAVEKSLTGYQLYCDKGGLVGLDFDTVRMTAPTGATTITLGHYGFAVSSRYTLVLRPVYDGLETPDLSNAVEFETDGDGEWLGNRCAPVDAVRAEVLSGGQVKVSWTYRTPAGMAEPNDFGVYYDTDPEITVGTPSDTVDFTRNGRYSKTFTLTDGVTYWFGVTSRTSGGLESRLSSIAGPLIADDTGPDTPTAYVSSTF